MSEIVTKNIGMMKAGSVFGCKTFFGYKLDIVKSGIQKYLRRRKLDEMIWCVVEMDLFSNIDDEKSKKSIRTNLMNRLIVMLDEELCFSDWSNFLKCYNLLESWNKEGRNDPKKLITFCNIIVKSEMLRLASDVNAYYRNGISDQMRTELTSEIPERLKKYIKPKDDDEIVKLFVKFVELFEKGDESYFYYSQSIYAKKINGQTRNMLGKRKRGGEYILWEYLLDRCDNLPYLKLCLEKKLKEFFVRNRKERHIFLINSLLLVFNKSKIDWNSEKMEINDNVLCNDLSKYYDNRTQLFFDDYVIDMHTSAGRKKGKSKKEFALEGSLVVDENKEWFVKKYRDNYISEKLKIVKKKKKKKKKKNDVDDLIKDLDKMEIDEKVKSVKEKRKMEIDEKVKKEDEKKKKKKERSKSRMDKYKRIKKMRGKPNFDDLEKNLEFVDDIDEKKITLCTDVTCGNKVMCFEYEGKIWKEGRKSMNYNRDYCVLDECKDAFGLQKISMKRVLCNFRIEKKDKSKKHWAENWHKVVIKKGEPVVYCVMEKINPGVEIGKVKVMFKDRKILKEYVKIGVFRGIFRVSDFNGRNVLIKDENKLVSIDEGDIGKRLDILGGREKWLVKKLNKDKSIINEILNELSGHLKKEIVIKKMVEYKFNDDLCNEVLNNWKNLSVDLMKEGIKL